jgi:hypothetical protein
MYSELARTSSDRPPWFHVAPVSDTPVPSVSIMPKSKTKQKQTPQQALKVKKMMSYRASQQLRAQGQNTDRKVRAPLAFGHKGKTPAQRGKFEYSHTEFISLVQDTNAFGTYEVKVNPGLATTFPWLAGIAVNFEFYRFKRITFRYVSVVGGATNGEFFICPEYDVNDAPPATMAAVYSTTGAKYGNVWLGHSMTLNPVASRQGVMSQWHKVRDGEVVGDNNGYDVATVYYGCAPTSGATASTVGKLEVSYDVEFFVPQTSLQHAPAASQTSEFLGPAAGTTIPTATSAQLPIEDLLTFSNGIGLSNVSPTQIEAIKGIYNIAVNLGAQIPGSGYANYTASIMKNNTVVQQILSTYNNDGPNTSNQTTQVSAMVQLEKGDNISVQVEALGDDAGNNRFRVLSGLVSPA